MSVAKTLVPAQQLAASNQLRYPNESAQYRTARNALLAEEIDLRCNIERVAALRRALPAGGEIPKDFDSSLKRDGSGFRIFSAGKTR